MLLSQATADFLLSVLPKYYGGSLRPEHLVASFFKYSRQVTVGLWVRVARGSFKKSGVSVGGNSPGLLQQVGAGWRTLGITL